MTRVISSSYTEGAVDGEGRRWVYEAHLCDTGETLTNSWLGSQDATAVLNARATVYNTQFAEAEDVALVLAGTKIPLSFSEFRELYPEAKIEAIDKFNHTFEQDGGLTNAQKDTVRTTIETFKSYRNVPRPFKPIVSKLLNIYRIAGLLSVAEVNEVLSHG